MRAKDGVGSYGERVAERHLIEAGFTVIDRNWRCDVGEVDLVAFDGDDLVICEVKTRSSDAFGAPLEAVTPVKLRRLWLLAMRYAAAHDVAYRQLRVDAVAVLRQRKGAAVVEHIRGIGS